MCYRGAWLSWLERTVHIREVVGSSPSAPTSVKPPIRVVFHICEVCPGICSRDLRPLKIIKDSEVRVRAVYANTNVLFHQHSAPQVFFTRPGVYFSMNLTKATIRVAFHIQASPHCCILSQPEPSTTQHDVAQITISHL